MFRSKPVTAILLLMAIALINGPTVAQPPAPASITDGENAPLPAEPVDTMVLPTAADNKGGATTYTQAMPLDRASLTEMRRKQLEQPELRGAWITRFDWVVRSEGAMDVEATKARIKQLLNDAVRIRLNAVFFQVRADASTIYPSKLEPWSHIAGGKDPGFDPFQFAIDEARKRNLEFHAYVNPVPCTEERAEGPVNKDHIWYKHCLPQSVPNWLVYQDGKIAPFTEYYWFNTNLPEVQAYIRWVMTDIVQRYKIDGLHFDRIRLPSAKSSDDPWSKARFAADTNPEKADYNQWQANNITRMLTDIYGVVMAINPKIKISAAVWGIYDKNTLPRGTDRKTGYSWTSSGLQNYHQDSIRWINNGCMDALVPMIYWNMGDVKPDYDELLLSFTANIRNGRHVYGGQRIFSDTEMLRQAVATQVIGGHGTVPFTLKRIRERNLIDFYTNVINPTTATLPAMPWKLKQETGIALINVKDTAGKAITDAHIKAQDSPDSTLSSADGFCAILNLKPGTHTITARKGTSTIEGKLTIVAGKATKLDLVLP